MTEEQYLSEIELEKKLLSGLMLDGGVAVPEAARLLKPDDFYRPEHRLIFKALLELSGQGAAIDVLLVESALRKGGDLKRVTRQYLFGLLPLEYTAARVPYYSELVKENARLRRLEEIGHELADEASRDSAKSAEVLAGVEKKLLATTADDTREVIAAKDLFLETISELDKETSGLATGFYALDKKLGGLKKSDLIILAARPSMGKTALAMNMAAKVARQNTVLVFSLEMSRWQLAWRFYSADSHVNATRIQNRTLTQGEVSALVNSLEQLAELKLHFDDTSSITLTEIKMKARRIKRKFGLDLIILDYLQLVECGKRYAGNRVQEVSELSRGLKGLARELDIPILALSQLSRNVEMRAEKRPQLSDLRESGSIEQDADIVLFLYRDEYYNREEPSNIAELIIAKNRNGATGSVPLKFEREYVLFDNLSRVTDD
ncbi:MAG: replicative DNA helicase [Selenomonadaceae bacterium]|nr:replicative DNA helicase [Selenomonadaceae bacterium]